MSTLGIVVSFAIIGGALVVGIFMIAIGQLMLAIREIALNTRKQEIKGEYKILELFANIWTILGAAVAVGGTLVGVMGVLGSFNVQ